jgi:sulfatase modifying factor 1
LVKVPPVDTQQSSMVVSSTPQAGEEREFEIAAGVKMVFCWIPAGEAQLGSPKAERDALLKQYGLTKEPDWLASESESRRPKFKTSGFWLGKYPVTQEEWQAVMGNNPSEFNGWKDNKAKGMDTHRFPVDQVNWNECQKFLVRLNSRGGVAKAFGSEGKFVLPHEDQWEYACRAGKGNDRAYYWGNELNGTQASCKGNNPFGTTIKGQSLERPCAVDFSNNGKYEKHPWGLCHMSGNVFQWCSNLYDQKKYVLRGGSWFFDAYVCRSANRGANTPEHRSTCDGFRVCLPLTKLTPTTSTSEVGARWIHSRGTFEKEKDKDGEWFETFEGKVVFHFYEIERRPDYTLLYDTKRDVLLWLYSNRSIVQFGVRPPSDSYQGSWEK